MKDTELFAGKSFSGLLQDIFDVTTKKRTRIDEIIVDLRKLVTDGESAVVLMPIIRDYLETMVKNDEHLVKMASIVQKMIALENAGKGGGLDDLLSDKDKERLLADALTELEEEAARLKSTKIPDPPTP